MQPNHPTRCNPFYYVTAAMRFVTPPMYHIPQMEALGQAQHALSAVQAVQQGTLSTAANILKGAEAAARAERELQEQ